MCNCRGAVWSVYQCRPKTSNKLYAVKILQKQVDDARLVSAVFTVRLSRCRIMSTKQGSLAISQSKAHMRLRVGINFGRISFSYRFRDIDV